MFQGASLWTGIISGGLSQLKDTQVLNAGYMDKKEYAINTTKNVSGSLGIMAGLEYGAMLGSSVMPGVGTVVGSIVGVMIGNRVGNYAGYQAGRMVFDNELLNKGLMGTQDRLNSDPAPDLQ